MLDESLSRSCPSNYENNSCYSAMKSLLHKGSCLHQRTQRIYLFTCPKNCTNKQ